MTVFTVTVGWVGSKMLQARKNRDRVAAIEESVTAIERLGMVVTSEYDERRSQTWLEKLFDDPGDSNDPVGISKVTEAGVVGFGFTLFTDADLAHVKGLTSLQDLWLIGTDVTDAGLEHLKGLTNLQKLNLFGTKVTDVGLEHLKGLTRLQELNLGGCNVTDAGLANLQGLRGLQELSLGDTNVTDAGVKTLQQALPNCKIHHGRLMIP